jgi:hypothetical protein
MPCRRTLPSQQAVELTVGLTLAWKALAPNAVAHVTDIEWGVDETPPLAENKPWPGLTEAQVREIARGNGLVFCRLER